MQVWVVLKYEKVMGQMAICHVDKVFDSHFKAAMYVVRNESDTSKVWYEIEESRIE